jgi:hypothetical protein
MKGSVFTILQDIEKLIYKILMWVILIPKTIIKITIDPKWALGYVTNELNPSKSDEHKEQFDEYVSPVILLLVVAWLPALAFSLLPAFGTTLTSPASEDPTTDRFISFASQTDFISSSTEFEYSHDWIVDQKQSEGRLKKIYSEFHGEFSEKNYIEIVDNNTVTDKFLYSFNDPGEYLVTVIAYKSDLARDELTTSTEVEHYSASLAVDVPLNVEEPIVIRDTTVKTASAPQTKSAVNFSERVKQEDTVFLALALMLPPLLFAFVIQVRTREGRAHIGEDTIKEIFYVQCYYFSPLSMAIWATRYAVYFFTADAYFYAGYGFSLVILLLPVLLAILWFFRIQMQIIMNPQVELPATTEQGTEAPQATQNKRETSSLDAFLVVIGCVFLLSLGAFAIFAFANIQDGLRLWSIRLYPLASIGLMAGFGYFWYQRRKSEQKKLTARNLGWVLSGSLLLVVTIIVIQYVYPSEASAPAAEAETDVAVVPADTATLIPIEPLATDTPEPSVVPTVEAPTETALAQTTELSPSTEISATPTPLPTEQPASATPTLEPKYYTEDFNSDLVNWSEFMSSGERNMVQQHPEPGKYAVDLLQSEEKLARYYLINDNFTYANVKVEAVIINRGNNTNGVSLICRYSDVGWYEFQISNGGTYSIYAVDRAGIVSSGFNLINRGTSVLIKSGPGAVNTYTITCKDQELSLYINQQLVDTITEAKFAFQEGKVGIGVSSPDGLPVRIEFDSLTVSEP